MRAARREARQDRRGAQGVPRDRRRPRADEVQEAERPRRPALAFTRADPALKWSANVGLFFHAYPHCSVNATHLHIVDLDATGPSFDELAFKNLPLDDCLQVLSKELRELRMRRKPSARFEKTADGGILEKTAADDGPTRVAAADFVTPRR